MSFNAQEIYEKVRKKRVKYEEERHCPLILEIFADRNKGTMAAFCKEVGISDTTFYRWCTQYPVFDECYRIGKLLAREEWEDEGRRNHGNEDWNFEYWRMIGWSRFGVGKNSRVRMNVDSDASPNVHYKQLMRQASEGDFTAGEIKQLVEAINVGLNAHQVFALQQEIDAMKKDLEKMSLMKDGQNIYPIKGTA